MHLPVRFDSKKYSGRDALQKEVRWYKRDVEDILEILGWRTRPIVDGKERECGGGDVKDFLAIVRWGSPPIVDSSSSLAGLIQE